MACYILYNIHKIKQYISTLDQALHYCSPVQLLVNIIHYSGSGSGDNLIIALLMVPLAVLIVTTLVTLSLPG